MPQPYNLFTIYAREDSKLLSELLSQLKPLEISGRIKVWSDREINPGVQWEKEIVSHLETADIILILVSPAYYNSEYIHRVEIKRAVERHQRGEAIVLPIIVRPCAFEEDPVVSSLQVLPTDGKAVSDDEHWRSHDKAWLDVVTGMKRTLVALHETEFRREQAALAPEQAVERKKEKRIQRSFLLPLRHRYIAIGGVILAFLLIVWLLPKLIGKKAGEMLQYPVFSPSDSIPLTQDTATPKDAIGIAPGEAMKQDSVAPNPKFVDPFEGQMIPVQGGSFKMGTTTIVRNRSDSTHNIDCQHNMSVSSFSIGKYEVTQAQWSAIMGNNPSKFKGCNECPVERVSWNDVQEFIKALNKMANKKYRLPSIAEWEYAAKGGNKSQNYIYIGSNDRDIVAWWSGNSKSKTHPVGGKKPNELGLYDMAGNVEEWCQDIYKNYPCDIVWQENGSRCVRGGSWGIQFNYSFMPWLHIGLSMTTRGANTGFRLAHD